MRVVVAGSTGFIGRRLVPELARRGHDVSAMVRRDGTKFGPGVSVVRGDVLKPDTLNHAFAGAEAIYFLVHSMASGGEFEESDRRAAQNTADAALAAGVKRIIYLGGLGEDDGSLSKHLKSRAEVGRILGSTGIPVTTLRAAIILGSGGISYEMLRHLVERLPVMITPRWVQTRCQPIAAADVIRFLAQCLENEETAGKVLDIGGPDVMTYREMMTRFARVEGKRRWIIGVPVLTPRLSSYWVNFVTPVAASVARPLIDGLRNEMVVRDEASTSALLPGDTIPYDEAVMKSLVEAVPERLGSRKVVGIVPEVANRAFDLGYSVRVPGAVYEARALLVDAPLSRLWDEVQSIGGDNGWGYMDWGWTLRGWLDGLIGGIGNRRGRPDELTAGAQFDTWVVDAYEKGRGITLRSQMRMPKLARIGLHVRSSGSQSVLVQWVEFHPNALTWAYWWGAFPLHRFVFRGMLMAIAARAERRQPEVVNAHA